MDNNFAELLTTGGWNTPTHFLERRLIMSVVNVLCTRYTHSLYPHCTHKVENAKDKGCTCTRCTRGSGIPRWPDSLPKDTLPKDILPKDILPNGHFADGRFAERTFCRTDFLKYYPNCVKNAVE
jgi:hypothetical protein